MSPDSSKYINRELSWLEFNQRVLEEAKDAGNPMLERLKFIAITASNLDEFFMKRVSGLKRQVARGSKKLSLDGLQPHEELDACRGELLGQVRALSRVMRDEVRPGLAGTEVRWYVNRGFWRLNCGRYLARPTALPTQERFLQLASPML